MCLNLLSNVKCHLFIINVLMEYAKYFYRKKHNNNKFHLKHEIDSIEI